MKTLSLRIPFFFHSESLSLSSFKTFSFQKTYSFFNLTKTAYSISRSTYHLYFSLYFWRDYEE
ncbi:hypothetical protein AB751O23_AA_00360 [Chlamydiales bacterium SCGC AB-751-O23]|nr:hypothetical protein AB751O23_AA_00360 [Chlamydiales bacterium SCGC AB-751-O23]